MKLESFIDSCHQKLAESCNYRRIEIYKSLYKSLCTYVDARSKLTLNRVFDHEFLLSYQNFLLGNECCENTAAFYLSNLRGIYTQAVAHDKFKPKANPFDDLIIRRVATRKRNLSAEAICKLMNVDLSAHPHLEKSRGLFILSLQLQGIPFVDLCHLRPENLSDGFITYVRRKTKQPVEVRLAPDALPYLKKLLNTDPNSPYLLNIVTKKGKEGYTQYQSALHKVNRHLKDIARLAGVDEDVSTYCARHSWASLAYHCGVDVGVVGQGLGHKTEEVTRTYLSNFAPDHLLEANLMVTLSLHSPMAENRIEGATPQQVKAAKEKVRQLKTQIRKMNTGARVDLRSVVNSGYNGKWAEKHKYRPKRE